MFVIEQLTHFNFLIVKIKWGALFWNFNSIIAIYFNKNYQSSIAIDQNLLMNFTINYPEYDKEWSYKLQCISTKQ